MKRLTKRFWTTKTRIGITVAAATIMLLLIGWVNNFFTQSQMRLNDLLFVPAPTSGSIVIVALDDAAHTAFGRSLASWPRRVYADLIKILNQSQARVIALDILFDQPTADDQLVAEAILNARQSDTRTRFVMPQIGAEQSEAPSTGIPALSFLNTLHPTSTFAEVVDYVGYVNAFTDVDSIVRRQISMVDYNDALHPSFDIATYLAYLRIPPAAAEQVITFTDHHLQVATLDIPVDENGLWQQNFFGGPANATDQTFPVYPLLDVISGKLPPQAFADKIVLVGLMNTTAATDLYPVPASTNGQLMAGVEIHANAVDSLIQNRIPYPQPRTEQLLMIVSLALVTSLIYAHLKWYWMLPAAILMTVIFLLIASVRFTSQLQIINLFYGLLAIIIPLIINLFADIAIEINRSSKAEFLLHSALEVTSQRLAMDRILSSLTLDIQRVVKAPTGAIWLTNTETQKSPDVSHAWGDFSKQKPVLESLAAQAKREWRLVRTATHTAVPMLWQKRLIGVIALHLPASYNPLMLRYRLRLLTSLAEQAAPSLENAALYTRTHDQNTLLEAILGGSPASIMVLEPDLTLIKQNKAVKNDLSDIESIPEGVPFPVLLTKAGIDSDLRTSICQALETDRYFRKEIKVGKKTFNLDAAKLDFGDWVIVLNDITALAEVNRLKTQMVRMTSHDLKKPLSRVLGYGSLLLDDPNQESLNIQQRQYLQRMFHAGEEMLQLINDILDLEQLRSSHIKTKLISVPSVLKEVIKRYLPDIDSKKQNFAQEIPDDMPEVVGDPLLLSQALSNLMENAVKYTPEAGSITARLRLHENYLRIEIQDSGYGISESAQAQLFQEFYRVRTRHTAHISGTGLGLSLARSIAEAHNGRIGVKSTEGVGSTFFIELPTPQEA